jgi:hypothetical protein
VFGAIKFDTLVLFNLDTYLLKNCVISTNEMSF